VSSLLVWNGTSADPWAIHKAKGITITSLTG
jgi:hypothetical protein